MIRQDGSLTLASACNIVTANYSIVGSEQDLFKCISNPRNTCPTSYVDRGDYTAPTQQRAL